MANILICDDEKDIVNVLKIYHSSVCSEGKGRRHMKPLAVFLCVVLLCTGLCSCQNLRASSSAETASSAETSSSTETSSSEIKKDRRYKYGTVLDEESGWCWEFLYCDYSEEIRKKEPNARTYIFWGTNLRYRYADDYWCWSHRETPEGYFKYGIKNGLIQWGGSSEAEARDMRKMREILSNKNSVQDLLAKEQSEFSFETLDGAMVYRLVHSTLEGPYTDEMPFENLYTTNHYPKSAMHSLIEPGYKDGYKFQVLYVSELAIIGNTYIDVLYQTGEEYNEYTQLSDLVAQGKATAEQKEAYDLIQSIRTAILEDNNFIASAEKYKGKIIGGIDFSRLYDFLEIIHESKWGDSYQSMGLDPCPDITVEISKEEYDLFMGKTE